MTKPDFRAMEAVARLQHALEDTGVHASIRKLNVLHQQGCESSMDGVRCTCAPFVVIALTDVHLPREDS